MRWSPGNWQNRIQIIPIDESTDCSTVIPAIVWCGMTMNAAKATTAIMTTGKKLVNGCRSRNWWLILKPILKSYEVNRMNKQHIHVGIEDTDRGFDRFVET